jgi:hypothetical protein
LSRTFEKAGSDYGEDLVRILVDVSSESDLLVPYTG